MSIPTVKEKRKPWSTYWKPSVWRKVTRYLKKRGLMKALFMEQAAEEKMERDG